MADGESGTVSPDVSPGEPLSKAPLLETQQAPQAASDTEPDYDAIFAKATPERKAELLKKHFADEYSRDVSRGISKSRKELEQAANEKVAQAQAQSVQRQQVEQQVNYLKSLPADQRGEWLSNPQNAAWYAQANVYLAANPAVGGFNEKAYTDRVYADFKKALAEDEGFADVDLDGIEAGESLGQYLANVAKARTAKERKQMQEVMKKEVQAAVAAEMAKIHATATEPGGLPPGGGSNGELTLEKYNAMTRAERAALSSADIDRMARRTMGFAS